MLIQLFSSFIISCIHRGWGFFFFFKLSQHPTSPHMATSFFSDLGLPPRHPQASSWAGFPVLGFHVFLGCCSAEAYFWLFPKKGAWEVNCLSLTCLKCVSSTVTLNWEFGWYRLLPWKPYSLRILKASLHHLPISKTVLDKSDTLQFTCLWLCPTSLSLPANVRVFSSGTVSWHVMVTQADVV